jgi:hypothetical protein
MHIELKKKHYPGVSAIGAEIAGHNNHASLPSANIELRPFSSTIIARA